MYSLHQRQPKFNNRLNSPYKFKIMTSCRGLDRRVIRFYRISKTDLRADRRARAFHNLAPRQSVNKINEVPLLSVCIIKVVYSLRPITAKKTTSGNIAVLNQCTQCTFTKSVFKNPVGISL